MKPMTDREVERLAATVGEDYWTSERWGQLRVGIKIRSNYESYSHGPYTGKIVSIEPDRIDVMRDDGTSGGGKSVSEDVNAWVIRRSRLSDSNFIQILDTHMASGLSANPLDFYRDMNDTEDSRLLKKYGLENPTNVPTEAGYQLARELMYSDCRSKIIEIVKKMEAAAKSSKKASE